jgi:hypothetical protein
MLTRLVLIIALVNLLPRGARAEIELRTKVPNDRCEIALKELAGLSSNEKLNTSYTGLRQVLEKLQNAADDYLKFGGHQDNDSQDLFLSSLTLLKLNVTQEIKKHLEVLALQRLLSNFVSVNASLNISQNLESDETWYTGNLHALLYEIDVLNSRVRKHWGSTLGPLNLNSTNKDTVH